MQDYRVNGSLGLLFAKLHVEGPMVRDRISFFVAARRSYFDLFLQMTDDYKNTVMNFYDLNAKVQYSVNENNLLFVSFFAGQDNMGLDDLMTMNWGNRSTTLRWLHRLDDRLHLNSSFIYSGYDSKTGMDLLNTDLSFDGYVNQGGIKESFTWTPDQRHTFRFGVQSTLLSLKSAEWTYNGLHEREKRDAWGNTLWLNDEWTVSERLQVSAGVRFNGFSALGGSPYYRLDESGDILDTLHYKRGAIVTTHMALKPRLSMNFRIDERKSLKLGYSRTSQNIHAIRPTTMARPFDRYTISSNLVRPQRADQVSLGWAALSPGNRYEFSVEGYFKSIDHVYDFKEGKSFSSEIEIERIILGGRGRAYGVEAYARKNTGRLTGWLAYTLSWSKNKIPGINGNRWYTAGNDRRHDISLVGLFELDRGWQMAAAWVYNTGQALSAPSGKYELDGQTIYYYAERNGYRAPSYHRLDSSFTHTKQKKNHTREWTFGIYNAYCRYNPYLIFFENDDDKPSGTRTVQYALFGIIPSVSYSFKF
ncbi:MAG: TonB-dependent receptor [Rikenellaceae bacterium]|nr:TonB-dependent receptor [Rikenellaceae bacterium]